MRKYFLVLLRFLKRIKVGISNQLNRIQRFAAILVVTVTLILMSQQVQAFDVPFNIGTEISNCLSGGCDPTRAEVIQSFTNRVEEVSEVIESVDWEKALEYYSNPTSAYRALWGEIADVADQALGGVISRNFGHVTNKWELRSALESQGIVIYGLEISQDEYIQATRATAASVATSNPGPLIEYFFDFAVRSVSEMGSNLDRAIESAPERLQGQYTSELQKLRGILKPEFIATSLATYVSTGEIPKVSVNIDFSKADVRFGILTYSRGERHPGGVLVTPNTHQPYIILTPPGLGVRVEQTISNSTVPKSEVIPNPQLASTDLHWYQHTDWQNGTTGQGRFRGGNKVGEGWNVFQTVFATSDGIVYGIKSNGDLHWYQHTDWQNGTTGEGQFRGGNKVGEGWNTFRTVFATNNGIIYGIKPNGDLHWYQHTDWQNGTTGEGHFRGGNKVGEGWNIFQTVFATSNGIIYGIKPNGDLHWYQHTDWQNGTTGERRFRGGNKVGEGWNIFQMVFATSDGTIYGIKPNGDLHWYQHTDWQNGTTGERRFRGGNKVGEGWNIFQTVFASGNGVIYGTN